MDIREYIINNFKEDSEEDIRASITASIESKDEEPLIGLGILFELLWDNSDENTKKKIITNIKNGITEK